LAINAKKSEYAPDIRVLCVNLEGSIAGAEQSLLLIVRFLPKNILLSAACPSGILADKLKSLGIKTYPIPSPPRKFNLTAAWLFYMIIVNIRLFIVVLRERPQIIHANSSKAVLAAASAKILSPGKIIWHMRDLRISRLRAKICGCLSSKIIAVSRAVKSRLTELSIKPELIEVIYNGIDTGSIKIKEKEQNDSIIFANIGQFVSWKKQILFIEAAERFLRQGGKANFLLIGDDIFARDGKYKQQLIKKAAISPYAQNIKIIGWRDNLEPLWPKIDCLVHTADAEPFGRVIIEAMANGVPIIATAAGGPVEIIDNGRTGLLFGPDDIEGVFAAMKTISEDMELRQNLAVNGRQHVIFNFQAGKTAGKIVKLYKELTAA